MLGTPYVWGGTSYNGVDCSGLAQALYRTHGVQLPREGEPPVCARVRLSGQSIARAAGGVINDDIPKAGGDGGAIALAADGSFALPFNTEGMYRGWIGADGVPHVAIYADDTLPEN